MCLEASVGTGTSYRNAMMNTTQKWNKNYVLKIDQHTW